MFAVLGRELQADRERVVGDVDDERAGAELVGAGRGGQQRDEQRECEAGAQRSASARAAASAGGMFFKIVG